ncbi:DUF6653 family protein [Tessaracoccus sp. OS52]|uniref:DUF6653 family protein n=1 Tax=Tessaracoccus sp. OS52 TaxID=2886691 RepID=UPI00351D55CD
MASNEDSYSWVFQRHAHPFSAWSRLLSTPLLLVPLWTRRWRLSVPIGAWFAVNPVITPRAHDTSSFATRAILGEESWTRKPYVRTEIAGPDRFGKCIARGRHGGCASAQEDRCGRRQCSLLHGHSVGVEAVGTPLHARNPPNGRQPARRDVTPMTSWRNAA